MRMPSRLEFMVKIIMCIWIVIGLAFSLICLPAQTSSGSYGDQTRPLKPSQKDRCPVCGMFVAKYPDFLAEILFKDGTCVFFDGTKDMCKYYFNLEKYDPSKTVSDIDRIYVTEYYSLDLIDGYDAFYVIGSDVYGPMGKELIPLANEADAKTFLTDHEGKSIFRFSEITRDLIESLD
jgi:copper chaperone NosL